MNGATDAAPSAVAQPAAFEGLPSELKQKVCQFVDAKDVARLSQCSQQVRNDVVCSMLETELVSKIQWEGAHETGDDPKPFAEIPVLHGVGEIHSFEIRCRWRDQGWGNRKGQLFLVAFPVDTVDAGDERSSDQTSQPRQAFDESRVVWNSPIASHREQQLTASFPYNRDTRYFLWCKVGGGGGHVLRLSQLVLRTFVMDAKERPVHRVFDFLRRNGAVQSSYPFFRSSVESVARVLYSAIENGQEDIAAPHMELFRSYELEPTETIVSSLLDLCVALAGTANIYKQLRESCQRESWSGPVYGHPGYDVDNVDDWWNGREDYDSFDDEDFIHGD